MRLCGCVTCVSRRNGLGALRRKTTKDGRNLDADLCFMRGNETLRSRNRGSRVVSLTTRGARLQQSKNNLSIKIFIRDKMKHSDTLPVREDLICVSFSLLLCSSREPCSLRGRLRRAARHARRRCARVFPPAPSAAPESPTRAAGAAIPAAVPAGPRSRWIRRARRAVRRAFFLATPGTA